MPTIPYSQLTLKLITGIFIYLLLQLNFFTLLQMGFPFITSLTDSLFNAGLLILGNSAIMHTFRYYQPPAGKFWITLVLAAVFAFLLALAAHLLLPVIIRGDLAYTTLLNRTFGIRTGFAILMVGMMVVLNILWNLLNRQGEAAERAQETLALAREAELFKLRQQLQPHFLFNSLNSINALVGSQPKEARKMIEQLSTFLRATINRKDGELVPLAEEMEQINRYLEIEKLRFGHRLQTEIHINENCTEAALPPLLLQPIVENAIKFGLYDTIGEVTIRLSSNCQNGFLTIEVTNPFDPGTSPARRGTGFGLSAVQRRLYLIFGRQDLLRSEALNNHFTTTINIPQHYVQGNNNR